ncbi:MAG: YceI family protein [Gammaproteobacteria bacterium]|jgi:polyisoprenoid-binding protein YceI|nr:YceI family protein [Gammaproteobacteria bacterium]
MTILRTAKTALASLAVAAAIAAAGLLPATAAAEVEEYVIDTEGAHAFIQFRIKHLGYSWLYGRFNDFGGAFTYDTDDPDNSSIQVDIETASLDSNHAERDKHLRGDDFLDVDKYPDARFESTEVTWHEDGTATVTGDLTLRGITKPVTLEVEEIGAGPDPWGGYRRGFEGSTSFPLKDFGIDYDLGPASTDVEMILSVEGIRQDG